MNMYSRVLLRPCKGMANNGAPFTNLPGVHAEDDVDHIGDIFTYRERPVRAIHDYKWTASLSGTSDWIQLSITICIGVGDQLLPGVSVRVFHDREYLEDEGGLRAAWIERTRMLERSIAARLTGVVRDILIDTVVREGRRRR